MAFAQPVIQGPPRTPVLGMVLKGFPRISETFISNEILLLEQQGFPIHIFSMRRPRETFSHESVKAIAARVDYLPESLLGFLPLLLRHNLLLAGERPERFKKALHLALDRFVRTRRSATLKHLLQAGYLVRRLLPGSGVTRLHAHFAHSPTSVAMFASLLTGLPFSFTAHAKDIYTQAPSQLCEKVAMARFVVTCTEYSRRYLSGICRGAVTPIHRIYHGIDTRLFYTAGCGARPPSEPYRILSVARLTKKKGLPTVLRALRILRDTGMQFQYTLIGDGEDRESILCLIRDLDLTGVIRWLGTRPHDVVLDAYRNSDLFVLGCERAPNGDRDGIPNVFLESMAMGVPVVATDFGAIPEVVENETTGLLVPPARPEALAGAMGRMLQDQRLRSRIVTAARDRIVSRFDNGVLVAELADLHRRSHEGGGSLRTISSGWTHLIDRKRG